MKRGFTYILSNERNGTLYIGVTSNLEKRIWEHKTKQMRGFSRKYNTHMLVHVEEFIRIDEAIAREKQLKKWNRKWKINLIERSNPNWLDLAKELDPRVREDDGWG
jgi:putative endonuclease